MRQIAITATIAVAFLSSGGGNCAPPLIASGGSHGAAVHVDGSVRTWGGDTQGQLGTGRGFIFPTAAPAAGLADVKEVGLGEEYSLALKLDGTVWTWGSNRLGELGDGTHNDRALPSRVAGLAGVTEIAAGDYHAVALKDDGTVWAWGANDNGKLGDGTTTYRPSPVKVGGIQDVRKLSAGRGHTLALTADGRVWSWGANDQGQLGDGATTDRYSPVLVMGLSGVTEISARGSYSVARTSDGRVWIWGANPCSGETSSTPAAMSSVSSAKAISTGFYHLVILMTNASPWACGDNRAGQLGDGTTIDRSALVPLGGLSNVSQIAAGYFHTLALKDDGSVWAVGANEYGQLGDGTRTGQTSPVRVTGLEAVTLIAAGGQHNAAVLGSNRALQTWGYNDSGQLGNGVLTFRTAPVTIEALDSVVSLAAGYVHTVVARADGSVWAWGGDGAGQLGDGSYFNRSVPFRVEGLSAMTAVAAGAFYTVALKGDRTVWTWGYNNKGQLGDGTNVNRSAPAAVPGLADVIAISAGVEHTVVLKGDKSVWAFGGNESGRLGDGTTIDRPTPVRVNGLNDVEEIATGWTHTLGRKLDGTVWAWGENAAGELGDGTFTDRPTPTAVSGLADVIAIAAGNAYSIALKSDGTVWTWGANDNGRLGDGTFTYRSTPVRVNGLSGIVKIAAGASQALALKNDGTVWSWGQNVSGQVGDGTLVDRVAPVIVLREGGAGSVAAKNWFLDLNPGTGKTIPGDKIPVFLAVASGSGATVTADIRPRARDVGATGRTYVFAWAPASSVRGVVTAKSARFGAIEKGEKDAPIQCVLAQLDLSGQLQAVSADALRAYATSTLEAQGQSVTLLDKIPAGNIDGATLCAGYETRNDANSEAMFTEGTNRCIATVRTGVSSGVECNPHPPQTGWWWKLGDGGVGYSIEASGNSIFFAAYLYDVTGRATWLVATGATSLDGSLFTNGLYSFSGGQTLGGSSSGVLPPNKLEGEITLAFSSPTHGTLSWPGGNLAIERFDIVANGSTLPHAFDEPQSGWWWNPQEPGRGFFLEWQGKQLFMAGYMYDDAGSPIWYLSGDGQPSGNLQSYSNTWQLYGNGQTLLGTYKPPTQVNGSVAPVTIRFQGAANAIMTLPGGKTTPIERFRF